MELWEIGAMAERVRDQELREYLEAERCPVCGQILIWDKEHDLYFCEDCGWNDPAEQEE